MGLIALGFLQQSKVVRGAQILSLVLNSGAYSLRVSTAKQSGGRGSNNEVVVKWKMGSLKY